jgi:DNA-binding CsgD family transcriptional regulator
MSLVWPLEGRAPEIERIRRSLSDGRSVVLAGAAGVGKSRLAAEVLPRAARVRASEAARTLPLGAFAPLLPAGEAGDNLLGWAAAAVRGTIETALVVDDAHLLDPASAALLSQLAEGGMRLLVTVRTGEPCPDAVAFLWREGGAERITVGPLDRDAIAAVLESALDGPVAEPAVGRLVELSQGNPLYLRELVTGALERGTLSVTDGLWRWDGGVRLSSRLTELIEARIGDLTPGQAEVMELVALGEPLPLRSLITLAGESVVEEAEERGLVQITQETSWLRGSTVRFDGGAVRLAHPLHGEAVRARLPRLRTLRRFRQLAELAEAAGEDPLRVALWRLESGTAADPEPLISALRLAWAAHDYPLAERFGRAAMEAGGGPRAAILLGPVLGFGGKLEEAEALLASVWDEPCDERTRTLLLTTRVNLLMALGRADEAIALVEAAEQALTSKENRQELTFWRVVILFSRGDFGPALELLDLVIGDPVSVAMQAQGHGQRAWILAFIGRPLDAIAATDRALATRAQWQESVPVYLQSLLAIRRISAVFAGDLVAAAAAVEEIRAAFEEGDWAVARSESEQAAGVLDRHRGRVAAAQRLLAAHDTAATLSNHHLQRWAELAIAAALAGDAPAAAAALERAEQSAPMLLQAFNVDLARPWVAAARGALGHAVELALSCAERMQQSGALSQEIVARHDAVRLGAAGKVTARLTELAGICQGEFVTLAALHAEAAADMNGAILSRVSEGFERLGFVLLAAEAAAQASTAYERAGRTSSARAATARAWILASACEGAMTPALARLNAPNLTPRELEIARLAAAALSNKQIADRLFLSVRTVENHLHTAYAKLGVSTRAELDRILRPPG